MSESEPVHETPSDETAPLGGSAREDPHDKDAELEHPSIRYERRDVPFRWVFVVAIAGIGIGLAIILLIDAFFRADTARLASRRESEFPLAEHPSNELPAMPRLEQLERLSGDARENVYVRELAKEDQLDLYGETQEAGFLHIPIRRAMQSSAGHLPVRKGLPIPTKDNGLVDSGAPNSGRLFRGAPR